jgi:CTP-dependent riboflavin kinase
MTTVVKKKRTALKKNKSISILEKMLEDRRMIKKHLAKGGKLSELKEKGINFATLPG